MTLIDCICPVCVGGGDDSLCFCAGTGLVTLGDAVDFCWDDDDVWLPIRLPRPRPAMDGMCVDCAFRADSPERDCPSTWAAVTGGLLKGAPFHCHQDMHCTADGRYIPLSIDHEGMPLGHPLCAGWLAARAAMEARRA